MKNISTMQRFMEKVLVTDGCWEWMACKDRHGYGRFALKTMTQHKSYLAHKFAYESFVGAVPAGRELDHLCSNQSCVNPLHLEPVTHIENLRRAAATITHCPQGHSYVAANVYVNSKGHKFCRKCAYDKNKIARLARQHMRASQESGIA